jgi:RNA polymerase sigma-70 factor, ECF subfamily
MESTEGRTLRAYISRAIPDGNAESHVDIQAASRRRASRLVEAARSGDREAFGDLYRMHYPAVYRLARFGLPVAAVDDAVAETFVRAWTALPRYRDTGAPFVAWLHGIARHVIADVHRRAARVETREHVPDGSTRFDQQETDRVALASALARLQEDQRRVIELKFLVGLANPEVAQALGKSVGAINALQWRALANLRRILDET